MPLKGSKLFDGSVVEQFCLTRPALLFASTTLVNRICHSLRIEQPAASHEKAVEYDDEESGGSARNFFGVELCLDPEPLILYGEEKPSAAKAQEAGLKNWKLSSSMIWTVRKVKNPRRDGKVAKKTGYGKLKLNRRL